MSALHRVVQLLVIRESAVPPVRLSQLLAWRFHSEINEPGMAMHVWNQCQGFARRTYEGKMSEYVPTSVRIKL